MKSINEKAEENCIKFGYLANVAYQEFVEGANYVLDEIETIIKSDLGSYKFQLDKIKEIIEQLKSNK